MDGSISKSGLDCNEQETHIGEQMRWSRAGAHLMLQTKTRVLDGTLRIKFQSWYPGLFDAANSN